MKNRLSARRIAWVVAACVAALVFGSVMPVDAAPKSPQGAKTAKIPLPELAPWHNRPAALGPGPNGMKRAEPVSKTQKTGKKTEPAKAATNDKAAATEPSVTTLVAPDPNAWTDDDISESLKACVAKLASIQARVEISEPFRKGACGAPAAVEVKKLGTKYPITMSPPAVLRCDMAVALYKFVEESLQPAAVAVLGSPIVSFNGIGSYQCRNRNGDPGGKLSEHALANALDVGTFKLANGASVKVVSDWGPTVRDTEKEQPADSVVQPVAGGKQASGPVRLASLDGKEISRRELRRLRRDAKKGKGPSIPPPPIKKSDALKAVPAKIATAAKAGAPPPGKKPQAATKPARIVKAAAPKETSEMRFLKRVHSEACRYFGTVLGPEANEAHRDHFHFDMAPRNRSNYCK